jgi:predicted transcriptional regulator
MMVFHDGMASLTHRTTFSFDHGTVCRLKNLATRWHVSQAEVIRRALAQAEKEPSAIQPDPIEMLASLHHSGRGLSREIADAYVEEVYEGRREWRGEV